jgi:hypothetical protein
VIANYPIDTCLDFIGSSKKCPLHLSHIFEYHMCYIGLYMSKSNYNGCSVTPQNLVMVLLNLETSGSTSRTINW